MDRTELDQLPPLVDVPTAAAILGIGRTLAYDLVKTDRWPTPVLRIGKLIRIPTAGLRRLIQGEDPSGGAGPVVTSAGPSTRPARRASSTAGPAAVRSRAETVSWLADAPTGAAAKEIPVPDHDKTARPEAGPLPDRWRAAR